jgi:hypothetical protein
MKLKMDEVYAADPDDPAERKEHFAVLSYVLKRNYDSVSFDGQRNPEATD